MEDAAEDCYRVLELDRHCSAGDIRRNFQRLAKKYHPDKLPPEASQLERDIATKEFQKISQAYRTLCDNKTSHDTALDAEKLTQKWPVSDTVDLDDMTFDPTEAQYRSPCRCGGCYVVNDGDLEEGVELVCCSMCSLSIKILYQAC